MPSTATQKAYSPSMGIEVREYYAAIAMSGLLANPIIASKALSRSRGAGDAYIKMFVATSFIIADYMIEGSSLPVSTLQEHLAAADMDRNA